LGTFRRGFFLRGIATNLPLIPGATQAWRKRVGVEIRVVLQIDRVYAALHRTRVRQPLR